MNLIEVLKERLVHPEFGSFDEEALDILLAVNTLLAGCPVKVAFPYESGKKVSIVIHSEYSQNRSRIPAIKAVRAFMSWGLKEAKEFVDAVDEPQCNSVVLMQECPIEQAHRFVEFLEEVGHDGGYSVKIN